MDGLWTLYLSDVVGTSPHAASRPDTPETPRAGPVAMAQAAPQHGAAAAPRHGEDVRTATAEAAAHRA